MTVLIFVFRICRWEFFTLISALSTCRSKIELFVMSEYGKKSGMPKFQFY